MLKKYYFYIYKNNFFKRNAMDFKAASNNEFTSKLESKIKELNMENECDFKKQNEKETPKAMNELMKHKNLLFYQELKQKRLSKIKSKLYHKLKSKVTFNIFHLYINKRKNMKIIFYFKNKIKIK